MGVLEMSLYGIDGKPGGNLVGNPCCGAACNLDVVLYHVAETAWPVAVAPIQILMASPTTGPTLV